ncbi:NAD(P)/FAD-dependent oxidoreductase [Nesterenkonia sp.]|uniref:phytoene desaturase family protein n=1 Tax=Nesterenkonia sp. TaxID=704201 RepID=UPI00263443A2|nr:NAD(P)/FAD-dependent oxidoreductase [Nesterenkonia sp.]
MYRAAVIGSGPNGLTAACRLAQSGWDVTVYEAGDNPGGAARSAELFGSGLISDLGASIHPLSAASPAYEQLLEPGAVDWAHAPIPAAHGDHAGPPVLLHSSLEETAAELGPDGDLWRWTAGALAGSWDEVRRAVLGAPTRPFTDLNQSQPRSGTGLLDTLPLPGPARAALGRTAAFMQLGTTGAMPATSFMRSMRTERARALLAGLAAHSTAPLSAPLTSAVGLTFAAAAHAVGWPAVRGGSQGLVDALTTSLTAHGGRIETGFSVHGVHDVPLPPGRLGARRNLARRGWRIDGTVTDSRGPRKRSAEVIAEVVVLDLSPDQLLRLEGLPLPPSARRSLRRWDYGPGVVKVDYLIDGPIPWKWPEMAQAGTVHLGGSGAQIAASEAAANRGVLPGRPYVLLAQPSAADPTRTPDERTVCWAYAHVPRGLDAHGAARAARMVEQEITRQAPQFSDAVLDRKVWSPAELQQWNPNLIGGSVSGGVATLRQTFSGPVSALRPYSTGVDGVYICSASAPPGGGAHGMAGYHAAGTILRELG